MGLVEHLISFFVFSVLLGTVAHASPTVYFNVTNDVLFEESTPNGTALFKVMADDYSGRQIEITIDENTETKNLVGLGAMEHQSGNNTWAKDVILISRLDRDREPRNRQLWFKVSDGVNEVLGRKRLFIRDVNDNPPFFEGLPYRIELPERTDKVNQTVFTVTASDPDDGPAGSVVYDMQAQGQGIDAEYNTTFQIVLPSSGGIVLSRELDYESRTFYQYQVTAKDQGNPSCPGVGCLCNNFTEPNVSCSGIPATFTVTVRDVQDTPPFFEHLPYFAQVYENATIGASVIQVTAQDGDRGVPNRVNYTIVGENGTFSLDETGIMKVAKALNADVDDNRFSITVMAFEIEEENATQYGDTNTTTQVTVTVLDVNDQFPEFEQDVYYATVEENTRTGVPITVNETIRVTDRDQSAENSKFKLSVETEDGSPYAVFSTVPNPSTSVVGTTTVMVNVQNTAALDYETVQNITFQLRATEVGTSENYTNVTTVMLSLIDVNDNSPIFVNSNPKVLNVTEGNEEKLVVASFTATDEDSGDYGLVGYELEDDRNGTFAIVNMTGNFSVEKVLDREEGPSFYDLVVVARDDYVSGDRNQQRSARHNVRINVLDIDDNAPQFRPPPSSVNVEENVSNGTVLFTLTAEDPDEGENGTVEYSVINTDSPDTSQGQDFFAIDSSTGQVKVHTSLVGHPGEHNVTFMARDKGSLPLNSTTSVVVLVNDVNMNAPVFVVPDQRLTNVSAGIVQNITIDERTHGVIIQVSATDEDTGKNGEVFYYLDADLANAFVNFRVNRTTGQLTSTTVLDRDKDYTGEREKYQLRLRAQDNGSPQLSSVIPFEVIVRDIDDNPPEFHDPKQVTFQVLEEASDVTVGYVNVSLDKDPDPANQIAFYYRYGGEHVNSFSLVNDTGELRLDTALNYKVIQQLTISVKATDNGSFSENHFVDPSNRYNDTDDTLLLVVVDVIDINNNPPVFDRAALTVGMLYDTEPGTEVFNLAKYTNDADTPPNSINYFRLLTTVPSPDMPVRDGDPFQVSLNGSVVTQRLFGSEEGGYFTLTVQAFDDINQNDTAPLRIYLVSNLQRVKMVFNKPPNELEQVKAQLLREMGNALEMNLTADKIATHITSSGTPDPEMSDMFVHGRYNETGEIVPASELWNLFDYTMEVQEIFLRYQGVRIMQLTSEDTAESNNDAERAAIIVAIALGIICLALLAVLINTIRRYRRRLKAATTSAFATTRTDTTNYVPPGTNQYLAAENPLFGKDVKMTDLREARDPDNDSLDDNAVVGQGEPQDDGEPEEQEMYLDLYDEVKTLGVRSNHLAMVLNEYDNSYLHNPASCGPNKPDYLTAVPPKEDPPANGHVKSDSGFNEHVAYPPADLDDLQHTDI